MLLYCMRPSAVNQISTKMAAFRKMSYLATEQIASLCICKFKPRLRIYSHIVSESLYLYSLVLCTILMSHNMLTMTVLTGIA